MSEPMNARRRVPYPIKTASMIIPEEAWVRTLQELRAFGDQRSEGLLFFGGVVSGDTIQVTGIYLLQHDPQGACVRVTREEARWLIRRLRERDEKLVAQVHSHPGSAFHSPGDNERAASFHAGYLSIVVPHWGHDVEQIRDCFVGEFDGTEFRELKKKDIEKKVRLVPMFEFRRPVVDTHIENVT